MEIFFTKVTKFIHLSILIYRLVKLLLHVEFFEKDFYYDKNFREGRNDWNVPLKVEKMDLVRY